MLAQQFGDRADKAVGRLDGRGGFLQRHYRIWTCLVVGDCLELVSFREKAAKLRINPPIACNQPEKLSMDASMSLGRPVGPLDDQGLSGMKGTEIGGSAGVFAKIDGEDGSSVGRESGAPCRGTGRPRASQIDAFAADLVHQPGALAVRAGTIRHRVYKMPGLGEYNSLDRRQAVNLAPTIGQVSQKNRDIVIGIWARLSARA